MLFLSDTEVSDEKRAQIEDVIKEKQIYLLTI